MPHCSPTSFFGRIPSFMTLETIQKPLSKIRIFLEMIKFEHSIFALPFAYLGLFLAHAQVKADNANESRLWVTFFWVTVAMVTLRTVAMSLNRLIDQPIDSLNPRTENRALPKKLLSRSFTWFAAFFGMGIFILATSELNTLCFALSPIPIALVWIYPYLKRFTWLSHWVLGLTLGVAPYGGWLAIYPEWSWTPGILTIAVTCWVSGFDVFYALQDEAFDRRNGYFSLPASFGSQNAILIAKISQGITVLAFVALGVVMNLGILYWVGVGVATALIIYEHQLVGRFGLTKINEAFFNMNAWVSVIIFAGTFSELIIHSRI